MSDLNYKELQERGVFDVPYKAFQFMQNQQAKIDAALCEIDRAFKCCESTETECVLKEIQEILK